MYHILADVKPHNLIVTGGVFFNVKLNHLICNYIGGKFCVTPLAGDQGAGLGVYQNYVKDLKWPDHLFWGHRSINQDALEQVHGIEFVPKKDMRLAIHDQLCKNGFVNLVRGSMEYGPRALCNTSTLALPEKIIGAWINKMNDRTNEMPLARQFKDGMQRGLEGGAHYYPITNQYTCRPQVTEDPLLVQLLHDFGPLINTSWNYHGVPIVRSTDDIYYTHTRERKALPEVNFKTIIQED
jgi:predicted NodU family carbamoyl transferase